MKFLTLTLVIHALLNNVDAKNGKIIGGIPTLANQYPYYALPINGYLCGATLISKDILISAAHCGHQVFKDGVRIGGNTYFYSTGKTYSVNQTLIHPQYDGARFLNDIMLIKINGMATEAHAKLNYDNSLPAADQFLTVIGHGATSEGGYASNTQLQVDLPIASDASCKQHYGGYYVNSTMLCSGGSVIGGKDACQGDSGGPLFLKDTDIQVGIVSFGRGCARPGVPAVNTRVSAYEQWIKEATCSLSSYPAEHCFAAQVPFIPATITPAPVTSAPVLLAPVTSAPVVPALVTSAPVVPAPVTSAPVVPAKVTPAPAVPKKVTSAPVAKPVAAPKPIPTAPKAAPITPPVTAKCLLSGASCLNSTSCCKNLKCIWKLGKLRCA